MQKQEISLGVDARCISGNITVKPIEEIYFQRKVRCQNRQIHKAKILKKGIRKLNQSPYVVMGYRLFDKVLYKNNECFISGRRTTGYFKLIKLDGIGFKIIRTKEFLFNREKKGGK